MGSGLPQLVDLGALSLEGARLGTRILRICDWVRSEKLSLKTLLVVQEWCTPAERPNISAFVVDQDAVELIAALDMSATTASRQASTQPGI